MRMWKVMWKWENREKGDKIGKTSQIHTEIKVGNPSYLLK